MILHIAPDEKFISSTYKLFEEVYPSGNEFLLVSKKRNRKHTRDVPARIVSPLYVSNRKFADSLQKYDGIILHYMDPYRMQLVAHAPSDTRFAWIGWGFDYYDLIVEDEDELLLPLTLEAVKKNSRYRTIVKNAGRKVRDALFFDKIDSCDTLNKIRCFSPVLQEEYEMIIESHPDFKPRYLAWNYGMTRESMLVGKAITGNDVLVGNSANYTNNHLDAFEILRKVNLDGRRVICPLSYGYPWYRRLVMKRGYDLFGDRFIPLTDFMPHAEYINLISSCSDVIMNHLRQQALGNIIAMLYLGARVFLQPRSPSYRFFTRRGGKVFTTDQVEEEWRTHQCLDEDLVKRNREFVADRLDRDMLKQKTRNLINAITEARLPHNASFENYSLSK